MTIYRADRRGWSCYFWSCTCSMIKSFYNHFGKESERRAALHRTSQMRFSFLPSRLPHHFPTISLLFSLALRIYLHSTSLSRMQSVVTKSFTCIGINYSWHRAHLCINFNRRDWWIEEMYECVKSGIISLRSHSFLFKFFLIFIMIYFASLHFRSRALTSFTSIIDEKYWMIISKKEQKCTLHRVKDVLSS